MYGRELEIEDQILFIFVFESGHKWIFQSSKKTWCRWRLPLCRSIYGIEWSLVVCNYVNLTKSSAWLKSQMMRQTDGQTDKRPSFTFAGAPTRETPLLISWQLTFGLFSGLHLKYRIFYQLFEFLNFWWKIQSFYFGM